MDHAERYFQLLMLGRDGFTRSVAPAALVRRASDHDSASLGRSRRLDQSDDGDTLVASLDSGIGGFGAAAKGLEVYPLLKKPGAAFADIITMGRTPNNDVVIDHVTVSRFHAFLREGNGTWIVCDAGSKNGTCLDGKPLEPRQEVQISPGARITLGDIEVGFYLADALFDVLGGTGGARV